MKTLVLFPRFDEDTQLLWDVAIRRKWAVIRGTPAPGEIQDTKAVCIYGGVMWGQRVAEQLGCYLSWPRDNWLVSLDKTITKRSITQMSGAEVEKLHFPKFVKSLNWKSITSRTYFSKEDLPPYFPLDEEYLVSDVVHFEKEFRAFILNTEIKTISPYAFNGELNYNISGKDKAIDFIKELNLSELPTAVCLDIGYAKNLGWAVIEANPAWCSGIYANDPEGVLDVVAGCVSV